MSRLEISARCPGFGMPVSSAWARASSTASCDLSGCSRSPTASVAVFVSAITLLGKSLLMCIVAQGRRDDKGCHGSYPDREGACHTRCAGAIAQLGERWLCKPEG